MLLYSTHNLFMYKPLFFLSLMTSFVEVAVRMDSRLKEQFVKVTQFHALYHENMTLQLWQQQIPKGRLPSSGNF